MVLKTGMFMANGESWSADGCLLLGPPMGFLWEVCVERECVSVFRTLILTSVQFSRSVMSGSLRPHELQHARPPCPSPSPRVHSNSCSSTRWSHPAISSSVVPFSSCPQSLPASESFPMSQLFPWGGQNTGVSALASFLPKNTQDWSPLGWTGWISLQSKGLSRVFSNTTVQKHQFRHSTFSTVQLSHPYMTTGKTIALTRRTFVDKVMSLLLNMSVELTFGSYQRTGENTDFTCKGCPQNLTPSRISK